MLGSTCIRRNKGQRHIRLRQTIQFSLGLLRCLSQLLHGQIIPTQINTSSFLLKLLQQVCQQFLFKILPTQHCISIHRFHLKHTPTNLQNTHIKRSPTQIKHCNRLTINFIHTIQDCCSSRLINNSQNIQFRNLFPHPCSLHVANH